MRIDLLTLFPSYFRGPFDESLLKRAQEKGLIDLYIHDVREYTSEPHRRVDDRPYGGGPGMVMMVDPLVKAVRALKSDRSKTIYLSPQGQVLTAALARKIASSEEHLILVCGHYEGIDQRVVDLVVDEEVSIGDYVLTNGNLSAIVLVDAVARFIPHVIGNEEAAGQDSFEMGIFDCPHYTRPEVYEGHSVPEVLLSGNHEKISIWRKEKAIEKTRKIRPDLVNFN